MRNLPPLAVFAVVGIPVSSLVIVSPARSANCAVTIVASQPVSQINVPTVPPLIKVTLLRAYLSVVPDVVKLLTRGGPRVVAPHLAVSPRRGDENIVRVTTVQLTVATGDALLVLVWAARPLAPLLGGHARELQRVVGLSHLVRVLLLKLKSVKPTSEYR
jgi:hypothetical protein